MENHSYYYYYNENNYTNNQTSDDETNHDLIESIIELEKELTLQQSSPISETESLMSQDYTAYHYNHNFRNSQGFYININNTCSKMDHHCQSYLDTTSSSNSSDRSFDLSYNDSPPSSVICGGISRSHGLCIPDLSMYAYDLDGVDIPGETTEQIARRIKEFLIENKISQRVLAENLLNMKQANLSPLLSAPKPWHNLTPIIRNRFLVMHMWLNDSDKMQKLNPGLISTHTSSANNK